MVGLPAIDKSLLNLTSIIQYRYDLSIIRTTLVEIRLRILLVIFQKRRDCRINSRHVRTIVLPWYYSLSLSLSSNEA